MLRNKTSQLARVGVGILFLGFAITIFLVPIGMVLLADAIYPGNVAIFEKKFAWIGAVLGNTICA